MHALIIANSPTFDAAPFAAMLRSAALLIAADGGGNALHAIAIVPHIAIGDLDSLAPEALRSFAAAGCEIVRHRPDKDETDLELALLLAVARGAQQIDVLGALGGRWDQGLSNVALLALPQLAGCRVRLLDEDQEAYLIRDYSEISGAVGDTVSLLPLGGAAHGITTVGLQYPLNDATLHFERSRGVSNIITTQPASVSLRSGMVLVVHLFDAGA
ncbi:thiamine diphosphokinase [Candidatus Gracilibacteria bacterium]|nr:thiamine diphosphokinase [Candidatus Gracilibacteria bacterium]